MKNERQELAAEPLAVAPDLRLIEKLAHWRNLGLLAIAIVLVFSLPLFDLAKFAAASDLYSYILLIPLASGYLIWLKWKALPQSSGPARKTAVAFGAGGLAVLAGYALIRHSTFKLAEADYLLFMMSAFLLFLTGGCWWFLGREVVRALAFPIGFLVFMVPMPTVLLDGITSGLQLGSAWAAHMFFSLVGATFLRDGLIFHLPGINVAVAPECSGIHSSLVLLISSSIASYLFLRSPWKRAVFVLAVIPLALLRNGFRVFVIGELCTHIGPEMVDSPIHHQGGPLFFALSLIPFFLLLYFLRRSERSVKKSQAQ